MTLQREQIVQNAEKLVQRGKIEPAIREYKKLLVENPNDINTLHRVGDLYARIQNNDVAIAFFTQIAEQYGREGFFVKAIVFYKKIIKLDPTRIDAYESLADLYHKQGLVNEARTQYQILADYYQKYKKDTSAIAILEKMANLEPENPVHRVRLAELFQQQKLPEKALAEYRLIAELMLRLDRAPEAAQIYERALDLGGDNLLFLKDAARALRFAGHEALAIRFLEIATERNPQLREVLLRFTRNELQSAFLPDQIPSPAAAPAAPLTMNDQTPRISEADSAAKPPRLAQANPQAAPQNAPEGKGRSSRDYASELEELAKTFLRRKTQTPSASPVSSSSTAKVTKEEPERAQVSPQASGAEGGIFICYRRSDSIDVAGRVYDRLATHYGPSRVFKDVDSIPFGVDFRKHLESAVAQANIFVVVIGKSWLRRKGAAGAKSGNLLSNPRDFIRIEIELALRLNLPIIPLLVGGARMPSEGDLPETLADLAYRNGMELRPDPNFHRDMSRLIAGMDSLLKPRA